MVENVDFQFVGGLEENVQYLKDAVLLPWTYNEIFKAFHIKPPRGILFHGPPGTGKTLTAAALATECKKIKRKVSFFSQNGAECLSMWLGESERKLRDLFKNAYLNRPSIIFFDELDALAPVRSVRMDHVHSSLVSTLLTLMDGLKSTPGVVVIGATNRLEEIDPALRRPGRFDRELFFPPPGLQARRAILDIHTRSWRRYPSSKFLDYLAAQTVGYCGADLQALCTEAFMCAMKRSALSPQTTSARTLTVEEEDFIEAKSKFVPSSLRSSFSPVRSLSSTISPLLQSSLTDVMQKLEKNYPFNFIFPKNKLKRKDNMLFCPRLILTGSVEQAHTSHLAPAILHKLEHLTVHIFDVTTLCNSYSDCSSVEGAISQRLKAARLLQPCILYLPDITEWWNMVGDLMRSIFLRVVNDLDPCTEIMLLATAHVPYSEIADSLKEIFNKDKTLIISMRNPTACERRKFFEPLFEKQLVKTQVTKQQANSPVDDKKNKRNQQQRGHGKKKVRRLNSNCDSAYETDAESDSPSIEEEWHCGNTFRAGCSTFSEGISDEKQQHLLDRLVRATENTAVHVLQVLYNKINMTVIKYGLGVHQNNYLHLQKDLEDIVRQCENKST